MPHNLLNDFYIGFVFTEAGTKNMPEVMDGKMPDKNRLSMFLFCTFVLLLIVSCVYSLYRKIYGTITCYDRMIIQGYIPGWSHAEGITGYLKANNIRIFDFSDFSQPLT